MAKQKRKPATPAVPLTRHPAFPAVVALWFGALFGLGSLAIRPGLIEALVLKTHLDTLIPAAAPPLGVTARICIALAMAVLGGLLGAKLAQFIARPKAEAHQRKRGAATINDADLRRRDMHPDAPARAPISAHEELGTDSLDQNQGPAPIAGRRRALAVEEPEAVFTVPEFAPLPGGEPQVIDLAELDLTGSEIETFEPLPVATATDAVPQHQDFATSADFGASRQVFGQQPLVSEPFAASPPIAVTELNAQAPEGSNANFGAPVAPPIDFSRPHEVVAAAIAARSEEAPLFARQTATLPAGLEEPAAIVAEPAAQPVSFDPMPITAEAVAEAAAVALDSLGLVELTERFAATLRKRRAALAASAAVVDAPLAPQPEPTLESAVAETASVTSSFSVPAFEVPPFTPSDPSVAVEAAAEPAPFAEPVAFVPQVEAPAATPVFAPLGSAEVVAAPQMDSPAAPLAMPAALRPIAFDDLEEDEDFANYLPLRHIPMPQVQAAAIAPVVTEIAAMAEPEVLSAPQAPDTEPAIEVTEAEDPVADGYSSLLEISKPAAALREQFVRIEEPDSESAAIEPVVIFPGQAARLGLGDPTPSIQPAAFAPPAGAPQVGPADGEAEAAQLRRFDAPSSAASGQVVAASSPAQIQDPAETDRALRAALATLQRMSGAA